MRKFALIASAVIILLVMIAFGMPLIIGFVIKNQYPKIINQLSNPPLITLKLLNFHRGWFESKARVQVTLRPNLPNFPTSTDAANSMVMVIDETIKHGPFILTDHQLMLAKAMIINHRENDSSAFNSKTIWEFSNKLLTQFQSQQLTLSNAYGKLTLRGLQGQVSYKPLAENRFVKMNTQLNTLNISQPNKATLVINNLNLMSDIKMENKRLWTGSRDLSIKKLQITTPQKHVINVDKINAAISQSKHKDKIQIDLQYDTQKIFGDDLNLGPIKFSLTFKDLDTKAFSNLLEQTAQGQQHQFVKPQQILTLYSPINELLKKGLSVDLNSLFIKTPDGPLDVTANIQLPSQNTSMMNIYHLVKHSTIKANLKIPREWLKKMLITFYGEAHTKTADVQKNIDGWIKDGFLIQEGNILKIDMRYEQGEWIINGTRYQPNNKKSTTKTAV